MTGYHYVRPYRRQDGTLVRGHKRRNPAPRIGVRGVLLFVAVLVILGSLAHSHSSGTEPHSKSSTSQQSAVTSAKTP